MRPAPPQTRTLLLLVSAACYLVSFSDGGEPLDARGLASRAGGVVASEPSWTPPAVDDVIRRDPFLDERPRVTTNRLTPPAPADALAVPDIDPQADPVAREATAAVDRGASGFTVRATIIGNRPVAFVASDGDRETIVGIGDSIGGVRVRAIDLRGVVLTDGTRLDLPTAYLATPAPRHRGPSRVDAALEAVATLRTLFERSRVERTSSTRSQPAPMTAPPRDPSPAPLRTVDARGLQPGVNPTPDTIDPTAQPYPYPYAPVPH